MDVIALASGRIYQCGGKPWYGIYESGHASLLKRYTDRKYICAYDSDGAGVKAATACDSNPEGSGHYVSKVINMRSVQRSG